MKNTVVVLTVILALLLSACTAIFSPTPGPTVDTAGTEDALFKTAVAQTLTAQPTLPPPFLSDTATGPAASPVVADSETPLPTSTLPPDLTTTPVTATSGSAVATAIPAGATITATLASGQPTASATLGIRTYGTLPPAVPFGRVTLINKAKAEAYISLQVTMPDGKYSIIEYPVEGSVKVRAPIGSYVYVAWVGGRKMTGTFRLPEGDDLQITLFKDKVVIK